MHFLRKAAKSILVISNSLFAMAMIVGAYGGWLNPSLLVYRLFHFGPFYLLLINAGFLFSG